MKTKRYCVYHHISNGEVFYVGMGLAHRPYEKMKTSRNIKWCKFVKSLGLNGYKIKIVKWFHTQEEANKFEGEELDRLNPCTNLDYKNAPSRRNPRYLVSTYGTNFITKLRKIGIKYPIGEHKQLSAILTK